MVPGHPPCALISLIFSSLDPETNCYVKSLYVFIFHSLALARSLPIPNYSVLQLAFFLNRFFAVQLSRCIRSLASALLSLSFSLACGQSLFHCWNRALKTIQTKLAIFETAFLTR